MLDFCFSLVLRLSWIDDSLNRWIDYPDYVLTSGSLTKYAHFKLYFSVKLSTTSASLWWWWWSSSSSSYWWWFVFVVWLTNERFLALFSAATISRNPHHRQSSHDVNLHMIWLCWINLCRYDSHYTTVYFLVYLFQQSQ